MTTTTLPHHHLPTTPGTTTWTVTTTSDYTATGHLPPWADEDPTQTGVPLERLAVTLADIRHHTTFDGLHLTVWNPADGDQPEEARVLWGSIDCHSYADDPHPRQPVANIALIDDHWITNLDPDGLTHLAQQLRTQADRLGNDIRPSLITARTDWTRHHSM